MGQAADDERLDADRRGAARPRLSGADAVKAVPILARTASLLAHLAEEQQRARRACAWRRAAEAAVEYEPPA